MGEADETVPFGVDGSEYEIDRSKKNATAFRRKLALSSNMALRLDEDSAADQDGPHQAGSAAAV
jgi:hypothetical protein